MDGGGPKLGKRASQKIATRDKLLSVAREAFESMAYDQVTFRLLAQRAGMSTGAFFSMYDSKSELFEAAIGIPAPNLDAFLMRVAIVCAGHPDDVGRLSEDAMTLRRYLVGP